MFKKKAYTLEEVIMYLEALETLDMAYTIERFPNSWKIEYIPMEVPKEESHIEFED